MFLFERCVPRGVIRSSDDTPMFSLNGLVLYGKVVSVYDGDTCKVVLKVNGIVRRFTVRMLGYDSPELRQKEDGATEARDRLRELVLDRIVKVAAGKYDKYGRLLATLYRTPSPLSCLFFSLVPPRICGTDIDVNSRMVEEGHGLPYDGGKKPERKPKS